MEIEVRRYVTLRGKDVLGDWLRSLTDQRTRAKISTRILRLSAGNFGDCKPLRDGVWELRVDWGPGYRLYFAREKQSVVLLLCGGEKRGQASDIQRAVDYWHDYKRRRSGP